MPPTVSSLWRYPVKAMAGESLPSLELDSRGVVGDRWYAVVDAEGRFAAFKNSTRFSRHDAMATLAAVTGGDGVRVSDGARSWAADGPEVDAALSAHLGADVRLAPEGETSHFDAWGLSLVGTATLDWCTEHLDVDADPRRLRANLVVATSEPFEEESWSGSVAVGTAVLRTVERIERCRTIDLEQNGARGTTGWLKALGATREVCAGVYLEVSTPGVVSTGDEVRVGG